MKVHDLAANNKQCCKPIVGSYRVQSNLEFGVKYLSDWTQMLALNCHHVRMNEEVDTAMKRVKKQTSPAEIGKYVNPFYKTLKIAVFFEVKYYN